MVTKIRRFLKHICTGRVHVVRLLSATDKERVAAAIAALESCTSSELRVVVEGSLHPIALLGGVTPRERAIQVFAQERVWDTENNNGVLLYLLVAERDAEIVADRGLRGKVSDAQWGDLCALLERDATETGLGEALIRTIERVSVLLEQAYPAVRGGEELPNEVIVR